MSVEKLLDRLSKVKKTGPGQWVACCPSHDDRTPSLAIRETDEGLVLLHCFGGCEVESVLGAVGMSFDELYPEKSPGNKRRLARPWSSADVLRLIGKESLIVAATAKTLTQRALSQAEIDRVMQSAMLIQGALSASGVEVRWS